MRRFCRSTIFWADLQFEVGSNFRKSSVGLNSKKRTVETACNSGSSCLAWRVLKSLEIGLARWLCSNMTHDEPLNSASPCRPQTCIIVACGYTECRVVDCTLVLCFFNFLNMRRAQMMQPNVFIVCKRLLYRRVQPTLVVIGHLGMSNLLLAIA